jgi:predicted short-subunit dehydrogenase-like oxidoreductase (DUF2520 family)
MKEIKSIALLGSGRVSTHLSAILTAKGFEIVAVYDRDKKHMEAFAQKLKTASIARLNAKINADLIIIAVSDDAVGDVARQLSEHNKGIVVHTSGAVPMNVIPGYLRRGVLYPLQSFSYDKKIVWENVPFCIEAEHDEDVNALGSAAERITRKVYLLNSEQRKALHLAAVFANNFANLMFEFSEELLAKAQIDRSILHPLILETANKVLMQPAAEAQTGPAMRGDLDTIRAHQELLGNNNALRSVYDVLTREIYNRSNHEQQL